MRYQSRQQAPYRAILSWGPGLRRKSRKEFTPILEFSTWAPLTENDQSAALSASCLEITLGLVPLEMRLTRPCEDFATLGAARGVPCAYWNFGGSNTCNGFGSADLPGQVRDGVVRIELLERQVDRGFSCRREMVVSFFGERKTYMLHSQNVPI